MLSKTLKDLKVKKLYGLLVHDTSDILKNNKELLNIILKSKKIGLVSKVGISVYDVNEVNQVLKFWKPDIIQLPINIFDQRFLKKNLLKKLKRKKIEIHARSCFLQGLLLEPKLKRGNLNSKFLFKKFVFHFLGSINFFSLLPKSSGTKTNFFLKESNISLSCFEL